MTPNPHPGQALCARCHTWRQPEELLAVRRRQTGVVRRVCKESVDWRCLREGVGPAAVDELLPMSDGRQAEHDEGGRDD